MSARASRAAAALLASLVKPRKSVTVGNARRLRGPLLSRAQADRRAFAVLKPRRASRVSGVVLYGLRAPLRAGATVTEARLGAGRALLPALHVRVRAWLYWEDLGPLRRYEHPSDVLVIAARGGKLLARAQMFTYPNVNGRSAFVGARRPRVLYRRYPSPAHPVHLSAGELARLTAVNRFRTGVFRAGDVAHSKLITLVDNRPGLPDETFLGEQQAITTAFASHGVATQAVRSLHGLSQSVDSAEAAGQTTVTLFLDGHGAAPYDPSQRTGSVSPSIRVGGGSGTLPDDVDPAMLNQIIAAHPNITFNVILDSCYSGRWVNPLNANPNVASVTTSSSATQPSFGQLTVTPDLPAEGGPFPSFIGPDGQKLYVGVPNSPDPRGLSPFTRAETAALDRELTVAGAGGDVTAAIKRARTDEPTYDVSAEAGLTEPSPDPFSTGTCETPRLSGPEDPTGGWYIGA